MRIRVGVDLNGDGWIDWGDTPPNVIPDPLWFHQYTTGGTATKATEKAITNYGLMQFRLSFGSGSTTFTLGTTSALFTILASTTYTAVVWLYTDEATNSTYTLDARENGGTAMATSSSVDLVAGQWTPLRVTFSSGAETGVYLQLNHSGASAEVVVASGWGVYAGASTSYVFASEVGSADDNLTDFVLGFDTQLGANDRPTALTAQDGTASVTLDNVDQEFSPRNADSPYFETLVRYRLLRIEADFDESGSWKPLFTGFVDRIQLDAGTASQRQARIDAVQGLMNLENNSITANPELNKTADELIPPILEVGNLPADRYSWKLDYSQWGVNTFIYDPDVSAEIQGGSYTYPVANVGWDKNTDLRGALSDLTVNEQGMSFVDREGRFVWLNREVFLSGDSSLGDIALLDANTDSQFADYQYRDIQATSVKTGFKPRLAFTGVMWDSGDEPLRIGPQETKVLEVTPETTEGYRITPLGVDQQSESLPTTTIEYISGPQNARVNLTISGEKLRLIVDNTSTSELIDIRLGVSGSGFYELNEQFVVVSSAALRVQNSGRDIQQVVSLNLIADNVEAERIAVRILDNLTATKDGIFSLKTIFSGSLSFSEQERLEFVGALTVGSVINIVEDQSMLPETPHLIVGEAVRYGSNSIEFNFTLLPLQNLATWILDRSQWGVNTRIQYD